MARAQRFYKRIGGYFSAATRERGAEYFSSGRVAFEPSDDVDLVEARVRGSRSSPYEVGLLREDRTLVVFCTCPHFADGFACKHIWAVVLAVNERGDFAGGPPIEELVFDESAANGDDMDELDDDLDDDEPYAQPEDDFLDDDEDGSLADDSFAARWRRPWGARGGEVVPFRSPPAAWRRHLATIEAYEGLSPGPMPPGSMLVYVLDARPEMQARGLHLDLLVRDPAGRERAARLTTEGVSALAEDDREILSILLAGRPMETWGGRTDEVGPRLDFRPVGARMVLEKVARTGRLTLARGSDERGRPLSLEPLAWDDRGAWRFGLELLAAKRGYELRGRLRRGEEMMDLDEPVLLITGGTVVTASHVAPLDDSGAFNWISILRAVGRIPVPKRDAPELLSRITSLRSAVPIDLPAELAWEEREVAPRPVLEIDSIGGSGSRIHATLGFDYDGTRIDRRMVRRRLLSPDGTILMSRDSAAEESAAERLRALSVSETWDRFSLARPDLAHIVATLLTEEWIVETNGARITTPSAMRFSVRSGIDWFDIDGTMTFGDEDVAVSDLLAALREKREIIALPSGGLGLLSSDDRERLGRLGRFASPAGGKLRFRRNQAALLDALVASLPEADVDKAFERAREELAAFDGIASEEPSARFTGELRPYQKDALGWFRFLERFGFGGCLADDMGLGKTVQVLAHLDRRAKSRKRGDALPSLVVVPRSLVFNWKLEAERFTPALRVLDHSGKDRGAATDHFSDYDIVLTTYGTLRRDAALLADTELDYVVLDEAQVIKNPSTQAAKAARLLNARHRLALSGTPVENHLGELASLFEFLNPGMLGSERFIRGNGSVAQIDDATRDILARALRPFILRRTKAMVAPELPERSEQTLYCELGRKQRKYYDAIRDAYRGSLASRIDRGGLGRAKMHVLEALLRLRQAACHPGLIDKGRVVDASAKLDLLFDEIEVVVAEGHKALVFSQFTSFLAIVRARLDKAGIEYAYLDGKSRDRDAQVDRFQSDDGPRLFLISLKAGGLGLNLTEADYVYLLDPWWNPAVEAQAIDRTHRIGQTRHVFAYRLVARDTVEERILELQQTKRDLADAIINADNSLIRKLTREDLDLLLS